jgi:hypothetical protein
LGRQLGGGELSTEFSPLYWLGRDVAHLPTHDLYPCQNEAEQNGCRQRLEGYLSRQQRLALAVA